MKESGINQGPAFDRRLLIISQVYPPDPAAVGQHLADVAEAMVQRGWRVTVYTASRGYDDPRVRYSSREKRGGVDVRRLALSSFGKRSIVIRLLAQLLFVAQALPRCILHSRVSCLLVSTSPPFAGFFGAIAAAIRRVPLVWWVMDVNPDQLIAVGRVRASSWAVRAFDWMNRRALGAARSVIVLDRYMSEVMQRKSTVPISMQVIHPWAAAELQVAAAPAQNRFRDSLQCDGRLVVMYSGNHAITSPLTTLLAAVQSMGHTGRLQFVFVGGGAGKADVDRLIVERPELPVRSLPYQPRESLHSALAAADVHVVSLADEAVGLVHPCKLYGAMAARRPIIALAPADSYLGEIVASHGIGWRVSQGDVAGMVAVLQELQEAGSARLRTMGEIAGEVASRIFSRDRAVAAVCDVIDRVATPSDREPPAALDRGLPQPRSYS
ncbi:MAG: glycosyltransferase family 4 protein [Planctomycetota bacterium]